MKKIFTKFINWIEVTAIICALAFFIWLIASWIDVVAHTTYQPWNVFQLMVNMMIK